MTKTQEKWIIFILNVVMVLLFVFFSYNLLAPFYNLWHISWIPLPAFTPVDEWAYFSVGISIAWAGFWMKNVWKSFKNLL